MRAGGEVAASPDRLVLLGYGRMGRAVEARARDFGFQVTAAFDGPVLRADPDGVAAKLGEADVAIDFTGPEQAVHNINACLRAGCPVVVGSTGWLQRLDEVSARVKREGGALLWAANFSPGVALLRRLAREVGRALGAIGGFDLHVLDVHHSGKVDAPSGTALMLAEALGGDPPITSIRTGSVPGVHEISLDAPGERLVLRHEARDRGVFADGALAAARWLMGRQGVFTMDDVLAQQAGSGHTEE